MQKYILIFLAIITCGMTYMIADEACCIDEGRNCCGWSDCCGGWGFYGDYLYWNTRRCDLDYAIPYSATGGNPNLIIGDVHTVDPSYRSGFRVGIMKCLCEWDVAAHYTYFHPRYDDSTSGSLANTRIGQGGQAITPGNITGAEADYDVCLDVLDIELGRGWCPTCDTFVRLFGGVKLAFLNQDFEALYVGAVNSSPASECYDASVDMDAYGLYLGGEGVYGICQLGCCGELGLLGNISVGTLVGKFERKEFVSSVFPSNGSLPQQAGDDVSYDLRDECWNLVGNINLAAGLSYTLIESCFCSKWTLSVGYEMHLWLNTADFIVIRDILDGGVPTESSIGKAVQNIGFDGLFARLHVAF